MAMNDNLIEVRDLKKHYNGGAIKALDGISVDIHRGDVMVVLGPSGSGKSTFLRSLNLLEEPTSGTIRFDGVDITDKKVDINRHRQRMGMVFQHFNLFPHKTILQNMPLTFMGAMVIGDKYRPSSMPSKPITETSSGTRSPLSRRARMAPTA